MEAKRKKILLCVFNLSCGHADNFPLALLLVRSYALNDPEIRKRTTIKIREYPEGRVDDLVLTDILQFKPDIVGFSCYMWNYEKTLRIAGKIKRSDPSIKIILGGPQASTLADKIIMEHDIDVLIRGEGEITFSHLIKNYLHDVDISTVDGITFLCQGKIVSTPPRAQIEDLDSIPSPFTDGDFDFKRRKLALETQRGCLFRCTYCYYHKSYEGLRYYGMARVKDDLKYVLSQAPEILYIMDPVFNINLERAKEICRFIIKHNKNNVSFHTELRAELLDEELASLMKEANFTIIEIGLQSTNRVILKNIRRKLNMKRFRQGISYMRAIEAPMNVQLIYGLPGENRQSFLRSLDDCIDISPSNLCAFKLMVLPGTEVRQNAEKYGIDYENKPDYSILSSDTFSKEDIKEFVVLDEALKILSCKWVIRCLMKDLNIKFSQIVSFWVTERKTGHLKALPPAKNLPRFVKVLFQKYDTEINGDFYRNLLEKEFEKEYLPLEDLL